MQIEKSERSKRDIVASRENAFRPLGFFYLHSICILGYSQNRIISFYCIQNENISLQFLICWSKLNHIPNVKRFEIPVYKLTADFIHFRRLRKKFEMVVLHDESSPQSQHANGKNRQAGAKRQLSRQ